MNFVAVHGLFVARVDHPNRAASPLLLGAFLPPVWRDGAAYSGQFLQSARIPTAVNFEPLRARMRPCGSHSVMSRSGCCTHIAS